MKIKVKKLIFPFISIILGALFFFDVIWSGILGVLLIFILNLIYFKTFSFERKGTNVLTENLIYDPVTGLFSSTYFRYHLLEDFQRAKRLKNNLSLLIFDIDHFNEINMNLGFRFGDLVLKEVANITHSCIRNSDVFSYLGGDEFGIILYNTNEESAKLIGERIIRRLTASPLTISLNDREEKIHFTISMGGATLKEEIKTPLELIDKARQNLERAKRQGGNNFIFE